MYIYIYIIWTPRQILDFTFFPKVNEAFVKPLYTIHMSDDHLHATQEHGLHDNRHNNPALLSNSEGSVMDISSLEDSPTASYNSEESLISIDKKK